MSGLELKSCPFCGAELIIGKQRIASCKTEGCAVQHRGVDLDYPKHIAAWNRRTPDTAQIRADALRAALAIAQEAVARRIAQIEEERKKPAFNIDVPQLMRWGAGKLQAEQIAGEILALIDTPLSPPAVDTSPAPDAGGKEEK